MRFLIDECLTVTLPQVAHKLGYEAYHVAHISLAGTIDEKLMPFIQKGDLTFVTNNATDFRRLYQVTELHAGLIILMGQFSKIEQQQLFQGAIKRLNGQNMINRVAEVTIQYSKLSVTVRPLPG